MSLYSTSPGLVQGSSQTIKTKTVYPVSVNEVKTHLRVDSNNFEDDAYIDSLLKAATQCAENFIEKDIAYTYNVLRIDDFSNDYIKVYEGNFLPLGIAVTDASSVAIGTIKQTSIQYDFFTIEWTTTITSDPLNIAFFTGYNDSFNYFVPEIIKQAVYIICGEFYDVDRSGWVFNSIKRTDAINRMLIPYKAMRW
jgi:hypothetical protein